MAVLLQFGAHHPTTEDPLFLAPGSYVIGRVHLGAYSSVWFNAVIRGDSGDIRVGRRSNVQDNAVLHADPGYPCVVGDNVTIGHGAIIHGAVIGDSVLIGMGAVIMNGARVGRGTIVGAGALIPEGREIPDQSLVLGSPGRVVRQLSDDEVAAIGKSADDYVRLWLDQGWRFH